MEILINLSQESGKDVLSEEFAIFLDSRDELAHFRERFHLPNVSGVQKIAGTEITNEEGEKPAIYLTGNSLGLQPKKTKQLVLEELDYWEKIGVEGHFHAKRPWLNTDDFVTPLAANVVGAKPSEVAVMNSLTTNLHLLFVPFYRPTQTRHKILIEKKAFPSDLYAVESQIRFHGFDPKESLIEIAPRQGEYNLRKEDILSLIEQQGESIALVFLSGVQYYTGQFFPMKEIVDAGHKNGCIVGFDLAHAVGNVVLKLHDWDVDFACWCSYKYLNSGPGGIGGAFVHEKHGNNKDLPRFAGWWGHDLSTRFGMESSFSPIEGAYGYRLSNPPVLCIAATLASLEIFEEAGIEALRKKSEMLTGYMEYLLCELEIKKNPYQCASNEVKTQGSRLTIMTPSNPSERGCQLSLLLSDAHDAQQVSHKLLSKGIITDYRKPSCIRAAPTPLYNTFQDVFHFVSQLILALSPKDC